MRMADFLQLLQLLLSGRWVGMCLIVCKYMSTSGALVTFLSMRFYLSHLLVSVWLMNDFILKFVWERSSLSLRIVKSDQTSQNLCSNNGICIYILFTIFIDCSKFKSLTFRLPSYFLWRRLPTGVITTPLRFRVRFNILYRAIHPLIQHCLLRKMVSLNIINVIATWNYEFFTTSIFPQ